MTIQNYLEETEKEFEEITFRKNRFEDLSAEDLINYGDKLKSFLHQRQLGLIELMKELVPEEREAKKGFVASVDFAYDKGFNECREQFLKNLELKEK